MIRNTSRFSLTLLSIFVLQQVTYGQFTAGQYQLNGYGNNFYGSKTGYFWEHPSRQAFVENGHMYTQHEGNNCSAIHVNVISRHGARYTSVDVMRAFSTLQNKLKAELSDQGYTSINNWQNRYPENKAELVTELGDMELKYIGYTIGVQLKDLLAKAGDGNILRNGAIKFGATWKTRTQESARSFQSGLSSSVLNNNDTSIPIAIRNKVLRFWDNCKNYEEASANNPEHTKFQNGPEMQTVRNEITKNLQLNFTLSVADVKLLWLLCATELAIMNNAEWCKLMTDQQREVLEYENDLEYYYPRLYGHPVKGLMACPLVSDVFSELDSAIAGYDSGQNYTYGMFQFGHSDTMNDFAASLGFFNDSVPLTADNFQQMNSRKFNNAKVDHFSTHFEFILYSCNRAGSHRYAIRLLFNGKPLPFPACNSDICWYDTVRQSYSRFIDQCDWTGVCGVDISGVPVGK